MKSRGLVLWISAAALAVAVTVPALAKGDAYTPGVNGVTAPSVLPETRVDPVLPEGVTLTKPVALRVEFVVGTLRTLGTRTDEESLTWRLSQMGQELYNPPNVDGWPGGSAMRATTGRPTTLL